MRLIAVAGLAAACAVGRWESLRAGKPATRLELSAWPGSSATAARWSSATT